MDTFPFQKYIKILLNRKKSFQGENFGRLKPTGNTVTADMSKVFFVGTY